VGTDRNFETQERMRSGKQTRDITSRLERYLEKERFVHDTEEKAQSGTPERHT
jgi:hypothetical protein